MQILEINNFTKSFKKTMAVQGLSLKVNKGSFWGFVGPNGAGKSTTVNFIAGLLNKDQGELIFDGEVITAGSFRYKSKIGFVLEKPMYFERLTGEEYLHFVGQMQDVNFNVVKNRTSELFEFLDLLDKKNDLIETYSTGMKKKISLAAALIHDPELLILDEPFEGIDPVSVNAIKENLRRMVLKGKTIILTSHVLEIVESLCTDIAIINKGELIYQGSVSSLYRKFHNVQETGSILTLEKIFIEFVAPDKNQTKLSWI